MDQDELLPGLVLRARGGFYEIETSHGLITASLRGRFKQNRSSGELVAVGDRVKLQRLPDGGAVIEQIEERTRTLSRRSPGRGQEQVIVANPDQAVFVLSCADPEPNFRMLDRLLVVAEREALPALICANKLDLVEPRSAKAAFGVYQQIGYPVLYTSALKGKGVSELRQRLRGKLSVFAGPSGAGKSSLLNRVQPGMALRTAVRELLPLKGGGYLADTPGLKAFALWDIEPDELDGYFREMAPLVRQCDFSDCTHTHEPGCAVRAAVERGEIDPERYDSYLRMRAGDTD